MASKWHGKQCPMCFTGVLRDGVRKQTVNYRGHVYKHSARGAFCNHCDDGVAAHDPREEKAWAAFRDRVDTEDAKHLASGNGVTGNGVTPGMGMGSGEWGQEWGQGMGHRNGSQEWGQVTEWGQGHRMGSGLHSCIIENWERRASQKQLAPLSYS